MHMSTLIMWHNRFSENENEAVEAHIPRHRDSKTKKPRHRDSKAKKPRHRETETINPRHRDSKTFFQRTKSHDIEIPRLKNHDIEIPRLKKHNLEIPRPKSHDIELLWNSDHYAPWYKRLSSPVFCSGSGVIWKTGECRVSKNIAFSSFRWL